MQRILVATDFSARSDRALRRAMLLARQSGARLSLVHVVDDDQPERSRAAAQAVAEDLLGELVQTLSSIDGVAADARVLSAAPFVGVVAAIDAEHPDLVVLGAPRRHLLRDVFVGTTVERIVRASSRPVLMACGVPTGFYRQLLVATDLSECSVAALRAVADLGFDQLAAVAVVHVFDAVMPALVDQSTTIREQADAWMATERASADAVLAGFLEASGTALPRRILKLNQTSVVAALLEAVAETAADILVVGCRGRGGGARSLLASRRLASRMLGGVATELLRTSPTDVLVVPDLTAA